MWNPLWQRRGLALLPNGGMQKGERSFCKRNSTLDLFLLLVRIHQQTPLPLQHLWQLQQQHPTLTLLPAMLHRLHPPYHPLLQQWRLLDAVSTFANIDEKQIHEKYMALWIGAGGVGSLKEIHSGPKRNAEEQGLDWYTLWWYHFCLDCKKREAYICIDVCKPCTQCLRQ